MQSHDRIVIVGAGVFGLSTALELRQRGYHDITVLDRSMPPVSDGSSVDISRIIRFDYADPVYAAMAKDAYDLWGTAPEYEGSFDHTPITLAAGTVKGRGYINKSEEVLKRLGQPVNKSSGAQDVRERFPSLSGPLAGPDFFGYCNSGLMDRCVAAGISFVCGSRGTVIELIKGSDGKVQAVRTKSGPAIEGDHFILASGAWTSSIVPMYNTTMATGQVLGFLRLSQDDMNQLKDMPTYINYDSGWFCFPPHTDTGYLKMAVHGYGYTSTGRNQVSTPPLDARSRRADFVPVDGAARLQAGLAEILPELATRQFERTAVCWYTDTPTGDFIMDHHPDADDLFLANGGSGHGFKFLPVLGRYIADAFEGKLPEEMKDKWRFRRELAGKSDAFEGDGSRGGPLRRELTSDERARL
ncbi:Putative FAD dependent oxidoreductase, FAD/NAD(P)-binding domain superfamily, MTOX family [Septoria linicola]|uniref:FAD dependent oxidoreductase, FAD/NAD(P)-binding domain superfamily, MTOX family n=1 Tax=Septoria linicola TaxID=215465 RepID=A0A9Q9B7Y9_9PEZI|nr:putative FAD dependent oxidoreductase, FAD/NAD(P)-binding domain superfamily, MTOX family [Septoria linicola]USW59068.1 Putative FAD dependent oxidoreductase, FAD/NAD(P)-binding domain superfamily, MTOX family [Septoria linicola]